MKEFLNMVVILIIVIAFFIGVLLLGNYVNYGTLFFG